LLAGWSENSSAMLCFAGGSTPREGRLLLFVRRNGGGHSTLGRADLHPNIRMKPQLFFLRYPDLLVPNFSLLIKLHLVLPLGTADIVKSFLTTILSTQYFLC